MQALAVREAAREPYSGAEAEPASRSEDTETEELADEIVLMAAHMHAYKRRYLELVAEFDRRRGWEPGGHRSCADWLAFHTGCDGNTAREHVRVARALEELPRTGEAMAEGRLSFSQARALTRVATPEAGAALMRAIEAASDALYAEDDDYDPEASPRQRRREAERRRADAAELVAERALAAGFGEDAPVSGSRAERHQVFLHVDRDTLSGEGEPGRSELEDGTRVSSETSRRLSCDTGLVGVLRGEGGEVLDVGRRRRTVPPALRRALEVRDRGCRFPGCGLRFTDAHHIEHWANGGETSLENCVLLCRRHHRFVHEEEWTVEWWGENRAVFRDPRGGVHLEERPDPPELPEDPVRELEEENRRRGADPGPRTASATWKGRRQAPDEVWYAALEAGFAAVNSAPP